MARGRKLGELLTQAGLIDDDQLRSALGEQRRWGNRLGITLVRMGFLREADLLRTLSRQLGVPVARLDGKRIAPEVLKLVPVDIAEKHGCIPLFIKQEQGATVLYVGTENPCDLGLIDDLAFRTGCRIRPVLMGPLQIADAVAHHYGPHTSAALPPEDSFSETRLESSDTAPFALPTPASIFTPAPELADGDSTAVRRAPLLEPLELAAPSAEPPPLAESGAGPIMATAAAPAATAGALHEAPSWRDPSLSAAWAPVAPAAQESDSTRGEMPSDANRVAAASPERPRDVPTRTILRAVTQLLIEKGVIGREELVERLRAQTSPRDESESR